MYEEASRILVDRKVSVFNAIYSLKMETITEGIADVVVQLLDTSPRHSEISQLLDHVASGFYTVWCRRTGKTEFLPGHNMTGELDNCILYIERLPKKNVYSFSFVSYPKPEANSDDPTTD